ncbi:unnamed protein product [Danaus chrysippus]|uniref:(African queen) hypothetical protein n=1 Tax=Danaus chrysippus TaxID=151541 RepID=A0A8J2QDK9_9NEOP|nr:unnamed protein product [Danaus chrysippus]
MGKIFISEVATVMSPSVGTEVSETWVEERESAGSSVATKHATMNTSIAFIAYDIQIDSTSASPQEKSYQPVQERQP